MIGVLSIQTKDKSANKMYEETNTKLLLKYKNGCSKSRNELIVGNIKLAIKAAASIKNTDHNTDDLIQVATIGLIKAVDRYNPDFNVRFTTYCVKMIFWQLKRFLIDNGSVKISRKIHKNALRINRYEDFFFQSRQVYPTISEIKTHLRISEFDTFLAKNIRHYKVSINEQLTNNGSDFTLEDVIPSTSAPDWTENIILRELINQLSKQEQFIIYQKYYKGKTQAELADILGITQVKVSRMEKHILSKLKKELSVD
jgi:RNA polymerase sporulation-specific sigma factor